MREKIKNYIKNEYKQEFDKLIKNNELDLFLDGLEDVIGISEHCLNINFDNEQDQEKFEKEMKEKMNINF